ncbi:helix-turn-helix transcriptional regulator [Mycolicibacterium arseniciresistens]|uniref:helix-turn-helix transcriptional regulator n=1 Tax=Mycolicibacterium arseniciresistens TaxID=3062257 RepID=UPI002E205D45
MRRRCAEKAVMGVAVDETSDRWISRQELADRYGVPVKTPAVWASKGTGPPFARFGRHVRYRLSDVLAWESERLNETDRRRS